MRRPLLAAAALFGAGCLLGGADAERLEVLGLLALTAALLALVALGRAGPVRSAGLSAAVVAVGVAAADVDAKVFEAGTLRRLLRGLPASSEDTPLRVTGVVRGDPLVQQGRVVARLDLDSVTLDGRSRAVRDSVRAEIGGGLEKPLLSDGQPVTLSLRLRRTGDEGVRDRVAAYGYCKSARLVEAVEAPRGGFLRSAVRSCREWVRRTLRAAILPGPERGLVLAMVLGDRSEIDEGTADAFRASGTYHVLALSGAQVALVAGLVIWVLRLFLVRPWLQAVLAGSVVGFYTLLVGGDIPVARAALMASAVLVGRALDLDSDAANLLGGAAGFLLVLRPAWITDVGFQLSFGATLGILGLTGPLTRGLPRLPLRLELGLAASVAAQFALAPVLAVSFHRLAPAAVLLNLAAVPLSSAVLLCGLLVLLSSPFGPMAAGMAGDLAWGTARALRMSGDLGPLGPWLDLRVPAPSAGLLAAYACGIVLLWRGRRTAGIGLLLAFHAALVHGPARPRADGRLHLSVIDVGQGDGLLLVSPSGHGLLVDAGGSRDARFDPGERKVAPELWRRGLRELDALLVTHAHPDHVGGAPYVLHAFHVAEVWQGPAALRDPAWRSAQSSLPRGPAGRTLAAGMRLPWRDGVALNVLGPPRPRRGPFRVRNEDSVVIEVVFDRVRLLLTGDCTGDAERTLPVRRAAVLKVPHHGSGSSSSRELIEAVRPRVAIVSAGAHNPFGHPRPEVLERYRRAGVLVLRTDRDGTVDVATDGARVWVRTAAESDERRIE